MNNKKLTLTELAELSILACITFVGKLLLAAIPNVHPVALMLVVITLVYGGKAFYAAIVYVALETIVYGAGIWSLTYLYIWPLLVAAVLVCKHKSRIVLSAIGLGHGLIFGLLSCIPYFFICGFETELGFWAAGLPYDIIQGVSNAVLIFILAKPLENLLTRLKKS